MAVFFRGFFIHKPINDTALLFLTFAELHVIAPLILLYLELRIVEMREGEQKFVKVDTHDEAVDLKSQSVIFFFHCFLFFWIKRIDFIHSMGTVPRIAHGLLPCSNCSLCVCDTRKMLRKIFFKPEKVREN